MSDSKKVEVMAVCLGSVAGNSRKTGKPYAIHKFYVDDGNGELVDYVGNEVIPDEAITSFTDLSKGIVKVGTLTALQSVYQRKVSFRFESFVLLPSSRK